MHDPLLISFVPRPCVSPVAVEIWLMNPLKRLEVRSWLLEMRSSESSTGETIDLDGFVRLKSIAVQGCERKWEVETFRLTM